MHLADAVRHLWGEPFGRGGAATVCFFVILSFLFVCLFVCNQNFAQISCQAHLISVLFRHFPTDFEISKWVVLRNDVVFLWRHRAWLVREVALHDDVTKSVFSIFRFQTDTTSTCFLEMIYVDFTYGSCCMVA
jgi:hypothetical protein